MSILTNGLNVLLILIGFGLLIFVHELGHFLAAKWAGIRTEAFAIGMGPVVVSWRKGVGFALGSTDRRVHARTGKYAHELKEKELAQHGIGETEYSLRWLPIGGFVKMLGQEDANPNAVSEDPRSYTQRPIGKRMIVVAAGVIMNLILAAILFVVAFMVGVPLEAPVVGETSPSMPSARVVASNAAALGVDRPGLQPGDVVTRIDGKPAETFADLQIASAMGREGVPIELTVERPGLSEPLLFTLVPEKDPASGLLGFGIAPASSNRLAERDQDDMIAAVLRESGLADAGVTFGMRLVKANGAPVVTYETFSDVVETSGGRAVETVWTAVDEDGEAAGEPIAVTIGVEPLFDILLYTTERDGVNYESGLLGLTPLVRIASTEGSANADVLQEGDIVLRAGPVDGPRTADFVAQLARHKGGEIDLVILRGDKELEVTAEVSRKGKLGVLIGLAYDLPVIAEPMHEVRRSLATADQGKTRRTAVAALELLPRTRFVSIGGKPIDTWPDIREALRAGTRAALSEGTGATVEVVVESPTPGREHETLALELAAGDVEKMHDLSWACRLPGYAFEPIRVIRSAGGNPLRAMGMGLEETHKLIVMTYLTIDRLIRGSVGVEQLRGPVGIVHLGTKIIDRGFIYVIFLLGMISVNLAVINFLPIPIVDGGLFLFLVYEKLKGRPPPLGFQNAATVVGLCIIGTVLLVVTWNDVMRLIG